MHQGDGASGQVQRSAAHLLFGPPLLRPPYFSLGLCLGLNALSGVVGQLQLPETGLKPFCFRTDLAGSTQQASEK